MWAQRMQLSESNVAWIDGQTEWSVMLAEPRPLLAGHTANELPECRHLLRLLWKLNKRAEFALLTGLAGAR